MATVEDIVQFWFGNAPAERRKVWFVKDPAFDAQISARFMPTYEAAAAGSLADWKIGARESLALIILTDQFARNMFRGSGRAFATDPIALAAARHVIDSGWDARMTPVERMFVYLPFEHSEVLADQERSLALFKPLAAFPETSDVTEYSTRHWEIVKRFGRFPHRNAALGRPGTPEEIEFLKQPGSGF